MPFHLAKKYKALIVSRLTVSENEQRVSEIAINVYGVNIVIITKINSMKSRILKAVLAMVFPIAIEYVIKKFTEKKEEVKDPNRPIPSPH